MVEYEDFLNAMFIGTTIWKLDEWQLINNSEDQLRGKGSVFWLQKVLHEN